MKGSRFDVLVIGGGATGSGVALECASRGLKCAMVDAVDFAAGASSRSTKLLHGGIRYLENAFKHFDVGELLLVSEALEERAHMMRMAPYMSSALPIVMPIYTYWQIPYFWAGVKVYDVIGKLVCGFQTCLPECHYASRANTLHLYPLLSPKNLKGSLIYFDGQDNDARMNLHLALTASINEYISGFKGAAIANHCRVVELITDENDKVKGARLEDSVTKECFEVRASVVVNCTGPYSDTIRKMADPKCPELVAPSLGVHVVLPKWYAPSQFGMIIPETADKRVLFLLPWEGNTLVGCTDSACELSEEPVASEQDVQFIVEEAAKYLKVPEDVIRGDVKAAWSGIRPLVRDLSAADTSKMSRNHEVLVDPSGLVTLAGGKWTTYRRMAEDCVSKIVSANRDLRPSTTCRTKNLLLYGCHDPSAKFDDQDVLAPVSSTLAHRMEKEYDVTPEQAEHLTRNYGFRALDVCEIGKKEGTLTPLAKGHPHLRAEVTHSIRNEMACTVADVLGRRVRLAVVDSAAALNCVDEVADVLAKEMGWSESRKSEEKMIGTKFIRTHMPQKKM